MILAVESSCDESALALFCPRRGVVWESVYSQIATHARHGGVVPELAVREHLKKFPELMAALNASSHLEPNLASLCARLDFTQFFSGPGV